VWATLAFAALGDADRAWEMFSLLAPMHHGASAADIATYKVEPYVVAGDVYAFAPHAGRGGWTWYTGSASWMYRIWLEEVLGFHLRAETLTMDPVIPADWPGFEIRYRYRSSTYEIKVQREVLCDSIVMQLDNQRVAGNTVPLMDDGLLHQVVVHLPKPPLLLLPGDGERAQIGLAEATAP
jgi:cellobiose phosphorylase